MEAGIGLNGEAILTALIAYSSRISYPDDLRSLMLDTFPPGSIVKTMVSLPPSFRSWDWRG